MRPYRLLQCHMCPLYQLHCKNISVIGTFPCFWAHPHHFAQSVVAQLRALELDSGIGMLRLLHGGAIAEH